MRTRLTSNMALFDSMLCQKVASVKKSGRFPRIEEVLNMILYKQILSSSNLYEPEVQSRQQIYQVLQSELYKKQQAGKS